MMGAAAIALATAIGVVTMTGADAADPGMATSGTKAATLRTALNNLLREHVYLAGAATGAALDGREAEFKAAAAAAHMQMIADPLAEAIVKQFPDRFRG
jgi:hypothetical protein